MYNTNSCIRICINLWLVNLTKFLKTIDSPFSPGTGECNVVNQPEVPQSWLQHLRWEASSLFSPKPPWNAARHLLLILSQWANCSGDADYVLRLHPHKPPVSTAARYPVVLARWVRGSIYGVTSWCAIPPIKWSYQRRVCCPSCNATYEVCKLLRRPWVLIKFLKNKILKK